MEHLITVDGSASIPFRVGIPSGGTVKGVYASAPVSIAYQDNESIGTLLTNVAQWEPIGGFTPAPTAYLVITPSAAAKVAVRLDY